MKRSLFTLVLLLPFFAIGQVEKPKLIVGIVVDQMRNDYLERFNHQYSEGGFKRMMRDGFYGANHHFSYMPTTTGPGHASIYTGSTPAVHGIAGNNWYDPIQKKKMYCAEDRSVKTIGAVNKDGQMSPRNLRMTTITDELVLSTNFQSKVIGISIKDRGAILPAGHLANSAYWLSDGNFISSSYYMDELPEWVSAFNEEDRVGKWLKGDWNTLLPIEEYKQSLADDNPYEPILADEKAPVFPRNLKKLSAANGGRDFIKRTPYGNSLVLEMATAAVEAEELGADSITDFLAISFSTPDYMGHAYGPRAIEVQDTYLRLDRELESFFDMLDEKVGRDNYLVFLTADHGAAEVGNFSLDNNLPGGYVDVDSLKTAIDQFASQYGMSRKEMIEEIEGNKLYWAHEVLAEKGIDHERLSRDFARMMTKQLGIYCAYPTQNLIWGSTTSYPATLVQNGLYPDFAGDVVWVLESGVIDYGPTGTTHGAPWRYDSHIPLLMMGWGVKQGKSIRETNIKDIAPTISMICHIPLPSGTTGSPIEEAVENSLKSQE